MGVTTDNDHSAPFLAFCDNPWGPEVSRFDSLDVLLAYVSGRCASGDAFAVPTAKTYGRQIKVIRFADLAAL